MGYNTQWAFLLMLYASADGNVFDCGDAEDRLRCKISCPKERILPHRTCPFNWICCLGPPNNIFTPLRQSPFYSPSSRKIEKDQLFAYLISRWNETDKDKHDGYKVESNKAIQEQKKFKYPSYTGENDIFELYPDKKSVIYCKKYRELTIDYLHAVPLLSEFMPFTLPMDNCLPVFMPLIVGGQNVGKGEFPHVAAVGYHTDNGDVEYLCGGSLISNKYVLTAAHCSLTRWGSPIIVMLGSTILYSPDSVNVTVKRFIKYPDYRPSSYYHDIALIELTKEVEFSQTLRPACLPLPETEAQRPGSVTIATGWGRTGFAEQGSVQMKKVPLQIMDSSKCQKYYANEISHSALHSGITERLLCAVGYASEYHDTCQGDSGGPLQSFLPGHNCMMEVVAVTSFGKTCGTKIPGVYTRIEPYVSWIEDIVWP